MLLDGVDSVEQAQARSAAVRAAVQSPLLVQGIPVELELRCGLTTSDTASADELLADAERAAGGERLATYRPPTRTRPTADVVELACAIDAGQLVLNYHPIVELDTGQVTGVEALVRWQHPDRGLLMPLDFIPLAEESGLIVQLGDWVLRTAGAQTAEWVSRGRALDVAINLSPLQMSAPGFADRCSALLAEVQAPVERIVLEVTESALLDQPDAAQSLASCGAPVCGWRWTTSAPATPPSPTCGGSRST